jgi:hypothetical protein
MVAYASVRVSTAQHDGEHQRSGVWASAHARRDRRTGARRGHPEGAARERFWRNVWYARDTGDWAAYLVGLDGRRDLGGLERLVLKSFWLIAAGPHRERVHCMTVRLGRRTARVRYNPFIASTAVLYGV